MGPEKPLPYGPYYDTPEQYMAALLKFLTTSDMLQMLCGTVHILDFLTQEPDLYETIFPPDWREWLEQFGIADILHFLLREDLDCLFSDLYSGERTESPSLWRGKPSPPKSLVCYVQDVRHLILDRAFYRPSPLNNEQVPHFSPSLKVGMKPKKAHEVQNFAAFIERLNSNIAQNTNHDISHFIDFGSGQSYLGRVLASPLYKKNVVAIERRHTNITGAMDMDVTAKIANKKTRLVNKKAFRSTPMDHREFNKGNDIPDTSRIYQQLKDQNHSQVTPSVHCRSLSDMSPIERPVKIQYIEHVISDGNLKVVEDRVRTSSCADVDRMQPAIDAESKRYILVSVMRALASACSQSRANSLGRQRTTRVENHSSWLCLFIPAGIYHIMVCDP